MRKYAMPFFVITSALMSFFNMIEGNDLKSIWWQVTMFGLMIMDFLFDIKEKLGFE